MPQGLSATLSEALRRARESGGWTQAELAERAGLAVEAYGRLERGGVLPRAETLANLSVALGVSSDTLLGLDVRAGSEREADAAGSTDAAADTPQLRSLIRRIRTAPPRVIAALNMLLRELERM